MVKKTKSRDRVKKKYEGRQGRGMERTEREKVNRDKKE